MENLPSGNIGFLRRKLSSFYFLSRYYWQLFKDRVSGLDFTSSMTREAAGIDRLEGSQHYGSTGFVPELRDALKFLKINKNDSILDYGSGKGAVLVTFNDYPFRRIAGIELSETLTEICRSNMKKLKLNHIETILGDATKFTGIDEFTCFYMANPFVGDIFSAVINNIIASAKRNPRKIRIIYYNPKCHDAIMSTDKFNIIQEFNYGARRLFIYQSKN
jgi:16S rRNA G966 N2-methylase RsmD